MRETRELMTAEELDALPPASARVDRWLLDGALVERWNGAEFHSPGHAAAVAALSAQLGRWCHARDEFRVFGYGCPYRVSTSPDTLLTFDASIVRQADVPSPLRDVAFISAAPVLAAEVVELDEDPDLLQRLVAAALRCGIGTVWVIDPVEEIVIAHRHNAPALYVNGGMQLTCDDLPGFSCPMAEIFE